MNSTNETAEVTKMSEMRCCPGRRMWKVPFIILAIIAIKSVLVMLIWNAMMPGLFHLPSLGYLQAAGLVVLARLLVGFGHGPGRHFGRHRHWGTHWAGLSQEERAKLREAIAKCCPGE